MRRGATRALLATSLLFAPAPFFVLFAAGLMPFPWIVLFAARGFLFGDGNPLMLVPAAVHLLADVGLLYLACATISAMLFALLPAERAGTAVAVFAVAEVVASFFPIYVLVGEHDVTHASLWGVFVNGWR